MTVDLPPLAFEGRGTSEAGGGATSGIARARALRKAMTPPERRLWNVLREKPKGLKFRRQHPVGPYTLDFFCHEAQVAVEIDGISHDLGPNPERDRRRDLWLQRGGIQTLRFRAVDVRDNLEAVLIAIVEVCLTRAAREPLHRLRRSPSPANAGEASEGL
ncbi:MAG TPA: endonuclease domain-containing protein [Sphingomicrobium sp.]